MIPVAIFPVLNRFDLLARTLASIDVPVDEVLVINNSGDDSACDGLDSPFGHHLRVLNLPSNLGIAGSWNLGIKLYPHAPFWLFGSADTSFLPGTLERFVPRMNESSLVKIHEYGAFALGSAFVERVGLFDENLYPAYFEDTDYNERITIANMNDFVYSDAGQVWVDDSKGSQTIKSDERFAARNAYTYGSNGAYLASKRDAGDLSPRPWDIYRRRAQEWL